MAPNQFVGVCGHRDAHRFAYVVWDRQGYLNLRKAGFIAASPDDQNIPDDAAERIIGELKSTMPRMNKVGTAKNMAKLTLQVFENLNARPPGWMASIGLLAWYGAAVMIAVIFGVVIVTAQSGGLRNLITSAISAPKMKYECHSMRSVNNDRPQGGTMNIVATVNKPAKAEAAYLDLPSKLSEKESLEIIGQTLIVKVSAEDKARQEWLDRFETYSTNAFVEGTNNVATFSFFCVVPNTAAPILIPALPLFLTGFVLKTASAFAIPFLRPLIKIARI